MLPLLACLLLTAGADAGTRAAPTAHAAPTPAGPRPIALLATDPAIIEKWVTLKPVERAKLAGIVDKVKIDERVALGIVLDGYELPKSRRVDLSADVLITDSTGRDVVDHVSVSGTKTWDPKTQLAVMLKPTGTLLFGTTDPEGVYKLKLTVWDQTRGTSTVSESTFTVTR